MNVPSGRSRASRRGARPPSVVGIVIAGALLSLLACGERAPAGPSPAAAARAEARASETAERYGVERIPPEGIEIVTDFSRIVLRDAGPLRAMYVVRDGGDLMLQTRVDLARPDRLLVGYTRGLFASYLFAPDPERVLIVGLGGGAMVRFLEQREPGLAVEAVDIDPKVLDIAERYFGTHPSERVRLIVADGYDFIRDSPDFYDVIYMDAFLRPSDETDAAGAPLRLKDTPFYVAMRDRLSPDGVVAFNLAPHPWRDDEVEELRGTFAQVYVFEVEGELNWVAIATPDPVRIGLDELRERAAALDQRFGGVLSFTEMVDFHEPFAEAAPAAAATAPPAPATRAAAGRPSAPRPRAGEA